MGLAAGLLFGAMASGRCVGVGDGDTVSVMLSRGVVKIRLEGIDCPELGQDFGMRAKQFTSNLIFGKTVQVRPYYPDDYGRIVGRVIVGGRDVSLELLKAGLAWHYKRGRNDPALAEAEKEARRDKRGLWSRPDPVPPWEYRKPHRKRMDPGSRLSRTDLLVEGTPCRSENEESWMAF
ncbi:MAG: thermonuclease family protein [Candidatus Aminicenantes bacterium]|nr:thermonuclease family protein [Candidatus Aminicenantes bacterium]